MSVAADIREALADTGIPCAQGTYTGEADTYFVIRTDEIADDYADDAPQHVLVLVQLHLFAPFTRNLTQLKRNVRTRIEEAGFSYPDVEDASENKRSSDGTEQHLVFEFEAVEVARDGGNPEA